MNSLLFQFEGNAIPDVVADVLFIDQNLMDGSPCPGQASLFRHSTSIQIIGDLTLRDAILDEASICLAHDGHLGVRAGDQHDAISLDALVLTAAELAFGCARLIDELST